MLITLDESGVLLAFGFLLVVVVARVGVRHADARCSGVFFVAVVGFFASSSVGCQVVSVSSVSVIASVVVVSFGAGTRDSN